MEEAASEVGAAADEAGSTADEAAAELAAGSAAEEAAAELAAGSVPAADEATADEAAAEEGITLLGTTELGTTELAGALVEDEVLGLGALYTIVQVCLHALGRKQFHQVFQEHVAGVHLTVYDPPLPQLAGKLCGGLQVLGSEALGLPPLQTLRDLLPDPEHLTTSPPSHTGWGERS